MLIHCPTCNTEYECEPGRYECECEAKFTVSADGTVSICAPFRQDSTVRCTSLRNVIIPNNKAEIAEDAFVKAGCENQVKQDYPHMFKRNNNNK